jgi:hypothetical protein
VAAEKVVVENINHPGKTERLDAVPYNAMKQAILAVLPAALPGITVAEMQAAILAHLPEAIFPGGARAGWWAKAVQLDLEAKKIIVREATKPLRLHRLA